MGYVPFQRFCSLFDRPKIIIMKNRKAKKKRQNKQIAKKNIYHNNNINTSSTIGNHNKKGDVSEGWF